MNLPASHLAEPCAVTFSAPADSSRDDAQLDRKLASRFDPSDRSLALWLLAPAALLLALVVIYPVGRLLYHSFFDLRLTDVGESHFIGFTNYADVLRDSAVWHSAGVTLLIVLVTVPGALVVGLGLALAANLESRWRWPVRLALLLPWAMPPGFVGMIFAWFFQTDHGVVNDLIVRAGGARVSFLLSENLAFVAICLASIWKASSFVALLLLAGLQSIDRSLIEVALVEGASAWQRFRHITLPLLLPSIWVALIFRTLAALQTFDVAYAMTQGGPGRATETLAILINKTTTEFLDIGYGSTIAVLLLLVSLLLSAPYLHRLHRSGAA
jgi:multiple sugar transport system permease protein